MPHHQTNESNPIIELVLIYVVVNKFDIPHVALGYNTL
jgi:hypothetical protein